MVHLKNYHISKSKIHDSCFQKIKHVLFQILAKRNNFRKDQLKFIKNIYTVENNVFRAVKNKYVYQIIISITRQLTCLSISKIFKIVSAV